jgi:thiosulfate/3-mercaptopyruvate sulfurtransferase
MAHTTLVSTDELAAHLSDPMWVVIDCRFSLADTELGAAEYEAAHIPGAVYAHIDDDLSGDVVPGKTGRHPLPDPDVMAGRLAEWGVGEGVQLVAYDDSGGSMAARLWWLSRWLGHGAVAVLDGGWLLWKAEGRPTSEDSEIPTSRVFTPRLRPDLVVPAVDVEQLRLDPGHRLLDARAAERFRGENETIDPAAGHIPGAISAPFADNLASDGRFLSSTALADRYRAILGEIPAERTIVYCGSGVTGAHDVLALAHAGLGDAKLYAGSWSEWITDPGRPTATGA